VLVVGLAFMVAGTLVMVGAVREPRPIGAQSVVPAA
jgi:hypothetical protein